MKKETSSKILNVLGWLNIVSAILITLLAIFIFTTNEPKLIQTITDSLKIDTTNTAGLSVNVIAGIAICVYAIIELIQGLLLKRAAKDGKKSTFLLIITILSLIGGVYTVFSTQSITNLTNILMDIFVLYLIINGRKD